MSLIPAPARQTPLDTPFELRPGASVTAAPRLRDVVQRFADDVAADGGPALVCEAGGAILVELVDALDDADDLPTPAGVSPVAGDPRDERHVLRVSGDGVLVRATTPQGAHRGLTSLRQLIATTDDDGGARMLPGYAIVDTPRVAWRGLSLDVVRCFFTPADVRAIVDMLSLYKFNVLHLHLSDNEGWRIELAGHPELADQASAHAARGRPGGFYTREEFADLVVYAAERFVTVVPEIDLPGHSKAILDVHPHLGTTTDAGAHPAAYLDPRRDGTMAFVEEVFGELAGMTDSAYLHLGGDEAFGMPEDLYEEFITKTLEVVRRVGKRPVGWQEVSRAGVREGDVVQLWVDFAGREETEWQQGLNQAGETAGLSEEAVAALLSFFEKAAGDRARAIARGALLLLSPTQIAYFDTPYAEPSADAAQEEESARLGLRFYAPRGLDAFYDWDPSLLAGGLDDEQIAGVEAAIWGESIENAADLQFLVCARLPGFAERGWSPRGVGVWDEYRDRLARHAPLWRRREWNYFRSSLVDWL